MLEHADIVTTTTPTLADHLRKWNPNVAVVPNSIDPEEWQVQPRAHGGPPRIGWTGGSTHFLDLALVLDALAELQRKTKFTFVIQGLTTDGDIEALYRQAAQSHGNRFRNSPLGRSIKVFIDKSRRLNYEFHPFVDIADHARKVCSLDLDIGIAPLVDTPFNRNKSCIKYYEYALAGAVTLASKVLPYSAEAPDLSRNTRDAWKERLANLIESDRTEKRREQFDWVMTQRNIEHNVGLWEKILQRVPAQEAAHAIDAETAVQPAPSL
jgi:hypothetical protein